MVMMKAKTSSMKVLKACQAGRGKVGTWAVSSPEDARPQPRAPFALVTDGRRPLSRHHV